MKLDQGVAKVWQFTFILPIILQIILQLFYKLQSDDETDETGPGRSAGVTIYLYRNHV